MTVGMSGVVDGLPPLWAALPAPLRPADWAAMAPAQIALPAPDALHTRLPSYLNHISGVQLRVDDAPDLAELGQRRQLHPHHKLVICLNGAADVGPATILVEQRVEIPEGREQKCVGSRKAGK